MNCRPARSAIALRQAPSRSRRAHNNAAVLEAHTEPIGARRGPAEADSITMVADVTADEAALARIRGICNGFEGADEGRLQDRPLFRVGRRRFAIFNGAASPARPRWSAFGRSLHFLTDPHERDALAQDSRFVASPHHGDRGWMAIRLNDNGAVDWDEVHELLDAAYRQVAPG